MVNSCSLARAVLASGGEGDYPVSVAAGDLWPQRGSDLGSRLEGILRRALAEASSAIAIGADTPLLTAQHLEEAISALQTHDAVLGPSTDGGFYLIGLTRCPVGLFSDLPWSSNQTIAAMRRRLASEGFSVAELNELSDVDTPGDIETLTAGLAQMPEVAPATRAWLSVLTCA